jgi:hypothetical protein
MVLVVNCFFLAMDSDFAKGKKPPAQLRASYLFSLTFFQDCLKPLITDFGYDPKLLGIMSGVRWQFYTGIALAALGGFLVTKYKPDPPKKPATERAAD